MSTTNEVPHGGTRAEDLIGVTERVARRFVELDVRRTQLASGDAALGARLANIEMGFLCRAAGIQADLSADLQTEAEHNDG